MDSRQAANAGIGSFCEKGQPAELAVRYLSDHVACHEKIRAIFFARATSIAVISSAEHSSRRVSLSNDTHHPHFGHFRVDISVLYSSVFQPRVAPDSTIREYDCGCCFDSTRLSLRDWSDRFALLPDFAFYHLWALCALF
jgi:hypothetical protein